jgi:shikimate dehydrogenase
MTQYAEVIGDPIEHSRSPLIHGFWIEALGIEARYDRRRVEAGGVAAYLAERLADPDWRGCNVTMPLKLEALDAADEAGDRAIGAGAANVLIPKGGKLVASNTDVGAIAIILTRLKARGAPMQAVTLLGNGGAARAALVALKQIDLGNVRIQSRDMAQARKLAVEFGLRAEPLPLLAPVAGDGLINATPLGMTGMPCLNCELGGMNPKGWVLDMITDPPETDLLKAAKARGLAAIDGLAMLVEQAATSFELFFGAEPPRDRDAELWQRLQA